MRSFGSALIAGTVTHASLVNTLLTSTEFKMFVAPVFRQAYDRLKRAEEGKASARYRRVLHLAVEFGEDRVSDALGALLRQGELPLADGIELGLREPAPVRPVDIAAFTPDLTAYDSLISEVAS
jgi:hypothetical protein